MRMPRWVSRLVAIPESLDQMAASLDALSRQVEALTPPAQEQAPAQARAVDTVLLVKRCGRRFDGPRASYPKFASVYCELDRFQHQGRLHYAQGYTWTDEECADGFHWSSEHP